MLLTPEQRLWRAVLEQAYADAEAAPGNGASSSERFSARSFLRAERPEQADILALVCDFAEIPADRIVVWARRRYSVAF